MSIANSTPPVALSPEVATPPTDRFADLDAERSLLAAILRDPAALPPLFGFLISDEFFLDAHRLIFAACLRLSTLETSFTLPDLESELRNQQQNEALETVYALLEQPPAPANVIFDRKAELASYVHRIREKAQQRRLLHWLETAHSRFLNGTPIAMMRNQAAMLFNAGMPAPITGYHGTLREFLHTEIKETEEIMPGLHRGEVAELLADEAQGKSLLLAQLGLSLAAGEACSPVLSAPAGKPLHVVYVNGDAAASRLREDMQNLLPHLDNQDRALDNLRVIFEAQFDGGQVTLTDSKNWQRLANWLRLRQLDLLILDEVPVLDAEANKPSQRREQASKVFANLRKLAKQANCAIVVAHSSISNGNRRRLGNALFAAADTVYHFRSDHRHRDDVRQIRCVQSRWSLPPMQEVQRDPDGGGYQRYDPGADPASQQMPTVDEIIAYVEEREGAHTNQIIEHFVDRASSRKIAVLLQEAQEAKRIWKDKRKSKWQPRGKGDPVNEQVFTPWYPEDGKIPAELLATGRYMVMAKREYRECPRCGTVNLFGMHCELCNYYIFFGIK